MKHKSVRDSEQPPTIPAPPIPAPAVPAPAVPAPAVPAPAVPVPNHRGNEPGESAQLDGDSSLTEMLAAPMQARVAANAVPMSLEPTMGRWIRLLIVLATLLLLGVILAALVRLGLYIHHTLLLFSLGVLVAYALDPLVEGLRKVKLPRSQRFLSRELSVILVFLGLIVLMALAAWALEGHLVQQISYVRHDYPAYYSGAMRLAASTDYYMQQHGINFSLTNTIRNPPPELRSFAAEAGRAVLPFVQHALTDAGEFLIVLLIALYFLLFSAEMREKIDGALPDALRERASYWETDVNNILGSFVRGQLIIALAIGFAAGAGCLLLGIRAWLLIGLFVVVTSLIPVFGPYIGAVPAVLAAAIGPTRLPAPIAAGVVVVMFVIINETGSKILYPKLVGEALGLHTVVVLFVLFAGLEVSGVVGVLFAAPLTALAIVTIVHLYRFWQGLPDDLLSNASRRAAARGIDEDIH